LIWDSPRSNTAAGAVLLADRGALFLKNNMTEPKRPVLAVRRLLLAALVVPCLARSLPAQQPVPATDATLQQKLVAAARQIIREFPSTRYSHKTHIDRDGGICEVDCSGFIVTILKQVSPEHLAAIRTTHKRPLAEDFYQAFAAGPPAGSPAWREIPTVANANVGDVIAWLKLERKPGDSTGHVMLLAEKPVMVSPTRARVHILDSTLHGHAHDTRLEGRSRIGEGTIWLELDAKGRPVGFHWKSVQIAAHEVPIRIGHAVPIGK
jgi:hypothetical protein